jgi:hypothetical protein
MKLFIGSPSSFNHKCWISCGYVARRRCVIFRWLTTSILLYIVVMF